MRITSVDMPHDIKIGDGLGAIRMERLGRLVVLAGRNGAGKTRLLDRIYDFNGPSSRGWKDWEKQKNEPRSSGITILGLAIPQIADLPEVFIRRNTKRYGKIEFSHQSFSQPNIFRFVPRPLDLEDIDNLTKAELAKRAAAVGDPNLTNIGGGTIAAIQTVQNRWREATHKEAGNCPAHQDAIQAFESLHNLIQKLVGAQLGRSLDSEATMFGMPINKARLSDGQKVLLQLSVALHAQGAKLDELILLLDEPENHLHPAAMLEFVSALQTQVKRGQLWIATHSIPLLDGVDPSSIWWMENGTVSHAGSIPKKVLEGLLGDTERVSKLADFLNYPAQLASNRFSTQCLISPDVVGFQTNDPQLKQIKEALQGISGGPVRMLDFGAGKGRLASALHDGEGVDKDKLKDGLEYVAFDSGPTNKIDCENAIARIYGAADGRYFNKYSKLLEKYDKESFDVVVMTNVLHEIEPKDWLSLFQKGGKITQLLKPEGFLLLVEDMEIPVGEKAHQKGFLVLDTAELKELFGIKTADVGFGFSSEREGRLKAHKIPRELLIRITKDSREKAIESVFQIAKEQIKYLRTQPGTYQNGRKHGFWVQQLANAELILEEWRGNR